MIGEVCITSNLRFERKLIHKHTHDKFNKSQKRDNTEQLTVEMYTHLKFTLPQNVHSIPIEFSFINHVCAAQLTASRLKLWNLNLVFEMWCWGLSYYNLLSCAKMVWWAQRRKKRQKYPGLSYFSIKNYSCSIQGWDTSYFCFNLVSIESGISLRWKQV